MHKLRFKNASRGNKMNEEARKEYNRERCRKQYWANPKKHNARCKKWRTNNPEKLREYERKRHALNPERTKEQTKKWCANNPERVKEQAKKRWKKRYDANPEKEKERVRIWRINNPKRQRKQNKKHYAANREKIRKRVNNWCADNPEKTKAYCITYRKTKRGDEAYLIKTRLSNSLNSAFKLYSKNGKLTKSKNYGVDFGEIVKHLGPCPGDRKDYHIDHIRPLVSFDFDDPEQVKLAYNPKNLRWLTAEENMRKGGKRPYATKPKKS